MDNEKSNTKQSRHIMIFTDGCDDCRLHITNVEIGKCAGCELEALMIGNSDVSDLIEKYDVETHPTTIIDEEVKIEGLPDFYWLCGDEFYRKLKTEFPLE